MGVTNDGRDDQADGEGVEEELKKSKSSVTACYELVAKLTQSNKTTEAA